MQIWMTLVLAVQLLSALAMIGLVLIQHGKGADMGASFGSGASGSLFGATGSANFLSRSTAVLRRRCSSSARWRWPTWRNAGVRCAAAAAACWTAPRRRPARRPPAAAPGAAPARRRHRRAPAASGAGAPAPARSRPRKQPASTEGPGISG